MEKTRTLFNVAVLFVLVLFGSVVPASAQSEGGGMTADAWAIIGVGAVLLGFIIAMWRENRAAHGEIGRNIKEETGKVAGKVEKVDTKVDEVNKDLKELNRAVGRVEGALGRPSETR